MAIVEAGNLTATDRVLEIGPGKGFLTRALLETGAQVTALEKDRDLLPLLTEEFKTFSNFTLIEGDALTFDPSNLVLHPLTTDTSVAPHPSRYKLIANIPYYITGAILERYLTHRNQPTTMVVLVQKEVAERVCARDGKQSILSLSVQAYGTPKLVYRVSAGSFHPAPKVDSAVLQIQNISRNNFKNQYHEDLFFKTVKAGFAHKRKLLLSNLKAVFPEKNLPVIFEQLTISPSVRAETLPLSVWLSLSNSLL